MRWSTKLGIAILCLAALLFGGWYAYLATRVFQPIRMPIALMPGRIRTPPFRANIRAPYEIEFEVEKNIPFDTLNCLLGMAVPRTTVCADYPEVVKAKWTVYADGKTASHGSSSDYHGGGWASKTISREIGSFDGQPGRRFEIEVDVLGDGNRLASGNPRLTVGVDSDFVEGAMFWNVLVIWPTTGGLIIVGAAFLLVSFARKRRESRSSKRIVSI